LLVVSVTGLLAVSGCAALVVGAAAGAGGYAWVSGSLTKEFMVPAQDLQQATERALRDLMVSVKEERKDRLSALYKAEFAEGQDMSVVIQALTERTAKVKIRVGIFGNKARSEMVLSAIEKRL